MRATPTYERPLIHLKLRASNAADTANIHDRVHRFSASLMKHIYGSRLTRLVAGPR
jgi:hypothetical protein